MQIAWRNRGRTGAAASEVTIAATRSPIAAALRADPWPRRLLLPSVANADMLRPVPRNACARCRARGSSRCCYLKPPRFEGIDAGCTGCTGRATLRGRVSFSRASHGWDLRSRGGILVESATAAGYRVTAGLGEAGVLVAADARSGSVQSASGPA